MKLSEAIRKGADLGPQAFGVLNETEIKRESEISL
jgi:hypothetical protein